MLNLYVRGEQLFLRKSLEGKYGFSQKVRESLCLLDESQGNFYQKVHINPASSLSRKLFSCGGFSCTIGPGSSHISRIC